MAAKLKIDQVIAKRTAETRTKREEDAQQSRDDIAAVLKSPSKPTTVSDAKTPPASPSKAQSLIAALKTPSLTEKPAAKVPVQTPAPMLVQTPSSSAKAFIDRLKTPATQSKASAQNTLDLVAQLKQSSRAASVANTPAVSVPSTPAGSPKTSGVGSLIEGLKAKSATVSQAPSVASTPLGSPKKTTIETAKNKKVLATDIERARQDELLAQAALLAAKQQTEEVAQNDKN